MPLTNAELRKTSYNIATIALGFGIQGKLLRGGEFGNGHINTTIAATFLLEADEGEAREETYIFQRINTFVFPNPDALMANVEKVIDHLQEKIDRDGKPDSRRRRLSLLRTAEKKPLWRDEAGACWRGFLFIANTTSFDVVSDEQQAYQAAFTFGEFTRLLADLPAEAVVETIPDFHHTPKRFQNLQQAVALDKAGRVQECEQEIAFARQRESICSKLIELNEQGLVPSRITHNDTKLGNVLLCNETGCGLCVVDLDTVMPGLALYDFGDLMRSCVCEAKEDETDLTQISVRKTYFRSLVEGFSRGVADTLTQAEKDHLAFSGRLITFEVGMRFLTDYLEGDVYFPTKYPNHNLDRARNQFALVAAIEQCEEELQDLVNEVFLQVSLH